MEGGGGQRGRWKKTRSMVWDHFTRHTGDDGNKRSKCNRCGNVYAYGHGTSTMMKHHKECLPPEDEDIQGDLPLSPPRASMYRGAAEGSEHPTPGLEEQAHHHQETGLDDDDDDDKEEEEEEEEEEARRDLARMIALHGHHPSVVDDAHFKSFVRRLNPRFKLPSREDIEKVCDTILAESWGKLVYYPGHAPGVHSFAVGKVKSMKAWEALYITRNFIDDEWNLHRLVDHAYMVLPPGYQHYTSASTRVVSREVVAKHVVSYILNYGQGHYPHMVAGEMTSGIVGHLELKRVMDENLGSAFRKKKMLSAFLQKNLGSADIDEIFFTTNMDLVLHSIGHCLLPDSYHAGRIFVLDSPLAIQNRQRRLSELGLDDPLEFDEHWYWCYCSLKMADSKLPLVSESPLLTSAVRAQLCNLWGTIYSAIKRISASSIPTSHLCLQELLKVRDALQSHFSAPGALCIPLTKTLEIVDVAIEDSYLVWSLPLVLDPRYKLRHIEENFHKMFDDSKAKKYILEVRKMVKKLYTRYTKGSVHLNLPASTSISINQQFHSFFLSQQSVSPYNPTSQTEPTNLDDNSHEEMIAANSTSSSDQARDKQCHSQDDRLCSLKLISQHQPAIQQRFSFRIISQPVVQSSQPNRTDNHVATKTELDAYLDDSPVHTTKGFDFDILNWWKVHGSVQYPTVARMARAALAMPTCSKLTSDQTAHVKSIICGYKK